MTSVFAFPGMSGLHIKDSSLKLPEDFENYDPEQHPHFRVSILTHLCQPIDIQAIGDNASIIATIPDDEIKEVTFEQLVEKGTVYGTGNLV